MPPKAKGKEKATPEKPAPVLSMRLQMKMAEEESKKKEAEESKANSESESEPELKVEIKSRSRARPSKTESKAKKDASSASESEQESSPKINQRRSTRVAAPPVSTDKHSGSKGKAGRAPAKRGKANQKAAAEQSADDSSDESESGSEEAEPAKPARKSTKTASKSAKKKAESSSESESEEEEPVRGSKGGRNKATAKGKEATNMGPKKAQAKATAKRGKNAVVSEKHASGSDDLLDSSDSNSDSNSSNDGSGGSSEGETEQKNAKSPQKRIGRPPGAKNKPKADQVIDKKRVPEVNALDTASATVSAPVVAAANRIKKKGMILDSEVEDQPILTTNSVSADVSAAAENKASVNFVLPADSSLLKLTQLGKTTGSTIPRSASSMSMASNNSITDLAGGSDIITATTTAKQSSIKRIGKKEHVNAEFLNSVKINRGEWLKGFEKKIDTSKELSGARKAAHHSSSYSSSYTSTNTSYPDHHSSSTALALWGTLFDDQKTQDFTRVFLEKVRMQVDKNNLKKTDKAAYQSVCAVVDKCDMYAVYDKDMYTYTEPSEYKRFIDMSLVLQDESVYTLNEPVQAEQNTESVTATNSASNATIAANATTTSTAVLASPYEIENETVPKPLHIEPNPSDVAKALTWWGMRPDDALLQEIDRKRAVRAQEYQIKVRQAEEKAEQERLKMLEAQAKQKADDERRLKWLERANRKPAATSTSTVNTPSEGVKPNGVAPPAPVRAAQLVRGPRDRDYSHPIAKPVAPPVPAPPIVAAPIAPPLPVTATPVPPPPPVLTVPTTTNTSKVHKDRDYGSTSTLTSTIDKPTTATTTVTTATTTTDDTTRTRRKSRDYSDEPSIHSIQTTTPSAATNATLKVPAKVVAKDRDYANSGSKDHPQVSKDNSRDDTVKSSSARTRDRSDSRQRDRNRDRADSRERSRETAKDPFGRDLIREPSRVQNTEPNGESSNREQGRSRGGKRSRSRSAPRSEYTIANANKPNPTNSHATKHSSKNDRNSDSFRSINTTGTTHTSNKNRTVSPVLSRALSAGRDGPRGGPSPPTVKSTVSTTFSTAGSSSGGFRDGSSKSTAKDSRDGSNRDASAPVHVSSKVVVPSNASSARNSTAAPTSSSGVSGGTSGGQKRPRSPSPTSASTSNKKDALGRSVPALLVTTRERNNNDTATNKTSANDKADGSSYDQKDKPLTPTSSYRERNVPRPQPGNSHLPHRDHNHHQGQGRGQDSSYNQNRSIAGSNNAQNQPSSRTVHVNDRNYSETNNRQYNNGNRDRSRQY